MASATVKITAAADVIHTGRNADFNEGYAEAAIPTGRRTRHLLAQACLQARVKVGRRLGRLPLVE